MGEYFSEGYTSLLNGIPMKSLGKTISSVRINADRDNQLVLCFDDGGTLTITNAASCCESRYWRTDDNLDDLVGAKLFGFCLKEGPTIEEEFDTHETAFLEVLTDKGSAVFCAHNEHNGYYGGINPDWEETDASSDSL